MKRHSSSMVLALLLGAALASFGGCGKDPPPDDVTSSGTGGSGGGVSANCGNGKLDSGEDCDDGNNAPDDGCTSCKVDECFSCSGDPSICSAAASGTMCSTGVCDAAGACVECVDDSQCGGGYCYQAKCAKCDDTTKNGDETDQDCGGAHCPDCAQGKACAVAEDCASTFCADGVCCDGVCDGACSACNLQGSIGECSFIAKYEEDMTYGAGEACLTAEGEACTGGGACAKAIAQMCANNTECASGKCGDPDGDMMKTCVAVTGEPCAANGDCQSNMCMDSKCL